MGQYAWTTTCPREFREDEEFDAGAALAEMCRLGLKAKGLHPVGEPRIDWYEITQAEVDFKLAEMRDAGIWAPVAPFAAGDWRVRVLFEVTEDAPEPKRRGRPRGRARA
jgi:hypothetical protein